MLPMTKAQWQKDHDLWAKMRVNTPWLTNERAAIENNADWLLARLYSPDAEVGARCGADKVWRALGVPLSIGKEPINWGDLHASVDQRGGLWVVVLEEASAGQCPALVAYVQSWLERWGWKEVIVQTEW